MTKYLSGHVLCSVICGLLIFSGCSTHPFSGSAAMRVEVEVYKGPLAEEPELQWASLLGRLEEVHKGLVETENFTRSVLANKGFIGADQWPMKYRPFKPSNSNKDSEDYHEFPQKFCYENVDPESAWYEFKFWRLFGILDDMDHFDCLILTTLMSDTHDLITKVEKIKNHSAFQIEFFPGMQPYPEEVTEFLQEVSRFSMILKDRANRLAVASTGGQSVNRKVRIAVVSAIVAGSEYGNQLHARADALMKQIKPNGLDRRELPPSVALREAEPTDFIHLYNWMNAEMGSLPIALAGLRSLDDRVKIVDRLFADRFWSKINTVYASGRGKVSMAFIKDDVGNWNLKSFDNDPEELLKAYTTFSVEALKKAADIAAEGFAPGASQGAKSASQLIKMATETAFSGPNTGDAIRLRGIIEGLHQSMKLQLTKKSTECKAITEKDIEHCLDEIKGIVSLHSDVVDGLAKGLLNKDKVQ